MRAGTPLREVGALRRHGRTASSLEDYRSRGIRRQGSGAALDHRRVEISSSRSSWFPDYAFNDKQARPVEQWHEPMAVERKILRRCYHILRELGDAAWRSAAGGGRLTMRCARACHTTADAAASSRSVPVATPLWGGLPERMTGRTVGRPAVGHPINHHVAGPSSVDPDKAGRRHAQRGHPSVQREAADDLNHNVFTSSLLATVFGGCLSASRSFVLAALRALHLDSRQRSTATRHMARNEPNNEYNQRIPTFTGVPNTDKGQPVAYPLHVPPGFNFIYIQGENEVLEPPKPPVGGPGRTANV